MSMLQKYALSKDKTGLGAPPKQKKCRNNLHGTIVSHSKVIEHF